MLIDKYNSEGYFDPTTYAALHNVEKEEKAALRAADFRTADGYRPLVYICSPYSGDIKRNVENARKYSRFAFEQHNIPMTPHLLYPQFINDKDPAERYIACHVINYVLVGKCKELWVFGGVILKGMDHEMNLAKRRHMKIRYFTVECEEVEVCE